MTLRSDLSLLSNRASATLASAFWTIFFAAVAFAAAPSTRVNVTTIVRDYDTSAPAPNLLLMRSDDYNASGYAIYDTMGKCGPNACIMSTVGTDSAAAGVWTFIVSQPAQSIRQTLLCRVIQRFFAAHCIPPMSRSTAIAGIQTATRLRSWRSLPAYRLTIAIWASTSRMRAQSTSSRWGSQDS